MTQYLEKIPERERGSDLYQKIDECIDGKNKETFDLLKENRIGKMILSSIENKFRDLPIKDQELLQKLFNNFLFSLGDYHDSRINLERAAGRRLFFDDIQKFQESVKRADEREKIAHNLFIDSLNILSRNMKNMGMDNSWRGEHEIFSPSERNTREKTREWMLRVFNEIM